jgi:ferredoxin
MKERYRRFSFLSDIQGIKNALGEMRGLFFHTQPILNQDSRRIGPRRIPDETWFIQTIRDKINHHAENAMEYPFYNEQIYAEPLVGFVRGNDLIFDQFKEIIGPHHFTPWEIMKWQAENNNVEPPEPEDISVVSFVMPLTQKTKGDNSKATNWVAERWAQSRLLGEIFSQSIVREIVTWLMGEGILAVSPDVTPMFNKKRYPRVGWASPWSHRHIAYAAGLGTFGMHDFLITEKGCAHRLSSFVVNLKLEPNRQRPDDIHAYCLHYQGMQCLKCAKRCPVNAITKEKAHDKEDCYQKVAASLKYCNTHYHIFIYGCGLCAAGVPCVSVIPEALRQRR